jgi:hypothetical protein
MVTPHDGHKREAEVELQLIRNPALKVGGWSASIFKTLSI